MLPYYIPIVVYLRILYCIWCKLDKYHSNTSMIFAQTDENHIVVSIHRSKWRAFSYDNYNPDLWGWSSFNEPISFPSLLSQIDLQINAKTVTSSISERGELLAYSYCTNYKQYNSLQKIPSCATHHRITCYRGY